MGQNAANKFGWFWDRFQGYLSSKDLRHTKQRQTIIEYFLNLSGHVDAETLHRDLHQSGQKTGLATIYRTLNMLKDAGLVNQHTFADGRALFELATPNDHHDHLVCQKCGTIVEFFSARIEELQSEIAKKHQFQLTEHRLEMFGICHDCQKK